MNCPKYTVKNNRLHHIAGDYAVPEEEPVVILRGKDPVALAAILAYIAAAKDEAHKTSMTERLEAVIAYQAKYPERTRVGCHNHT